MKNPLKIESGKKKLRKKPQHIYGQADDMLIMNLRMKIQTQGGQSRTTVRPVAAHQYGYNDSSGDLRQNIGQKLIFDPQNQNRT
jgi:hypothetical protein